MSDVTICAAGCSSIDGCSCAPAPRRTFTPGPWKAEGTIYEHMAVEVRCVMPGEERGVAQVWQHANAFADGLLMAAAPDFLALAQDSVEILKVLIEDRELLTEEEDEVSRDLLTRTEDLLFKLGASA